MAKNKKSKLSSLIVDTPIPYVPTAADKARERKYEVESALNTMKRAEEIKKDKNLMKDIKKLAKTEMSELKKIC